MLAGPCRGVTASPAVTSPSPPRCWGGRSSPAAAAGGNGVSPSFPSCVFNAVLLILSAAFSSCLNYSCYKNGKLGIFWFEFLYFLSRASIQVAVSHGRSYSWHLWIMLFPLLQGSGPQSVDPSEIPHALSETCHDELVCVQCL